MKKLTARYKNILIHRARKASKSKRARRRPVINESIKLRKVEPFEINVWDGADPYRAKCTHAATHAPATLCLYENTKETLSFLTLVRDRIARSNRSDNRKISWLKVNKRGLPAIRSFFDFSTIDSLSTAVALIITSDYDRAKRLTGKVPPAVNLDQWGDDAFKVLYEIGFFEIMGYVPGDHPSVRYHDIEGGRFRLMQIMSGRNADELENVAMGINGLLEYLGQAQAQRDLSVEINSAVGEAMINVARHAYPKEFTAHNHNRTVNRWWVTARADRTSNTLTIVIYDQGATIPGTLPRRAWFKEFVEGFMRKLGRTDAPLGDLDHEYIAYSMLRGKTQTDEPGRGEGLPEMQDLIDFCGTGCLRILSRGGAYTYEPDSGVSKIRLPIHIEGTLVEWVLKLPSVT